MFHKYVSTHSTYVAQHPEYSPKISFLRILVLINCKKRIESMTSRSVRGLRYSHEYDISKLGFVVIVCLPSTTIFPASKRRQTGATFPSQYLVHKQTRMSQQGQSMIQDPTQQDISGNYYHQENDLTGGLPINLDSLRDGPPGTKPFYPYSTLIRYVPHRVVRNGLCPHSTCRRLQLYLLLC